MLIQILTWIYFDKKDDTVIAMTEITQNYNSINRITCNNISTSDN